MKNYALLCLLFSSWGSYSQNWNADLKDALEQANIENKKVLLYFSVPDACDPCIALEKNIFISEEFKKFAAENYILAKADFSDSSDALAKEENLLIVEKYNKDGFFPLVVILDKSAKVLGKTGIYNNEVPDVYIAKLKSLGK